MSDERTWYAFTVTMVERVHVFSKTMHISAPTAEEAIAWGYDILKHRRYDPNLFDVIEVNRGAKVSG